MIRWNLLECKITKHKVRKSSLLVRRETKLGSISVCGEPSKLPMMSACPVSPLFYKYGRGDLFPSIS